MGPDFEALPRRMVAMEEDAFREFAEFFGPRFRALFLSRRLPSAEADDLAISCVTDIALKIDKYDASRGGHFEAWVFTLARRNLIDWWRRHQDAEPLPDDLTFSGTIQDESESLTEVVDAVREAVAKLPVNDQALVRFRDLGGMEPYSHIAERLGIQPETARVRHYRALRRLRALLEPDPRIQRLLQKGSVA
jgi:RNA polymerase sigma factor (sigma-70 family)